MTLVVTPHKNGAVADPTRSLKQALVNFEHVLTDEEKRQYQTGPAKPDTTSVIAFVTQIDAKNSSASQRCVAQRLCTFLDATQQFSGVVGTFVSSNPIIAALVWGAVKTAILTASNVVSYFDKVTSMIMNLGRSCPTYQQYSQLYPGCKGLQRALCNYYATVVQLCIKIIEVSKRTVITQTLSSIFNPFESEFKSFLDELDQAAKEIEQQMSLASKQADQEAKKLLELESQKNTAYRQLALKFQRQTRNEHAEAGQWRISQRRREEAKLRSNVRDNLSTIDHIKPWKQAMRQRVPATAEWLLQESDFLKWKDDPNTTVLWCSGTMGGGKTVLASNVVAQLHASRKPHEFIAYYFCRADYAISLSARSVLGSLARQLLDTQIENAESDNLQSLYAKSRDLDAVDVVDFFLSHLEIDKTYYLILDGLDECEGHEIRQMALSMAKICEQRVKEMKILCTGRPELEDQLFQRMKPKYRILVSKGKVQSDMDQYIATALSRCLDEGELKLGDPTLILKISEALREGSDGM